MEKLFQLVSYSKLSCEYLGTFFCCQCFSYTAYVTLFSYDFVALLYGSRLRLITKLPGFLPLASECNFEHIIRKKGDNLEIRTPMQWTDRIIYTDTNDDSDEATQQKISKDGVLSEKTMQGREILVKHNMEAVNYTNLNEVDHL